MASKRLKYLTLPKLTDAMYFSGMDGFPTYGYIAGPTGIGKSWSTKALRETRFVIYQEAVLSPKEHRELMAAKSVRTKLYIHDDLGLVSRWNAREYFSTFIMCMEGSISHTMFKNNLKEDTSFSLIVLSTDIFFNEHRKEMEGMGMMDRMMPIALKLSRQSRREYQDRALSDEIISRDPPLRRPIVSFQRDMKKDPFPLGDYDINPRNLTNLRYLQRYLDNDTMDELIDVVHGDPYEYSV